MSTAGLGTRTLILILTLASAGCSVITMTRQTPPKPMGREITASERTLMHLGAEDDEYKLCDHRGTCAAISCASFREVQDCRYFGPPELFEGYVKALGAPAATNAFTLSGAKSGGRAVGSE